MSSNLIRAGGVAAMLGGMLWIVAATITASKPRGYIGPECDIGTMRDSSDVAPLLLLALLLSAIGLERISKPPLECLGLTSIELKRRNHCRIPAASHSQSTCRTRF